MPLEGKSQVLNIDYREVISLLLILVALTVVVLQLTDKVDVRNFTAEVYDDLASLMPGASSGSEMAFEEEAAANINLEALGLGEETGIEETVGQETVQEEVSETAEVSREKTQAEQMKDKVGELRREINDLQIQLHQMQNKVDELQERIEDLKSV